MASERLDKLCAELEIPMRHITEEEMSHYREQHPSEETMIDAMKEVDQILEGNVVTIGGFCASSKILGFRKMRRISNDLDCITNEDGIRLLKSHFGNRVFRTENYGDIFLDYEGIPAGFDVEETHGWEIPQGFYYDEVRFNFGNKGFNSISPEYLIALKARRSIAKGRFYGKDAIDTANMVLAPHMRGDLTPVDYNRLGSIMIEHSSDSVENVNRYLEFVSSYETALKNRERPLFRENLCLLRESVGKVYLGCND